MLISEIKESKYWNRLPPVIKNHTAFNSIRKIVKPFPEIGLSNSLDPLTTQIDGKNYHIGFSSSGIEGFWDLATMSMRGVCSCMHWLNHCSQSLVGSVLDPFLGIVYLTDNELTECGISFRRRALVRFMHQTSTKTNQIFIERIYKDTGNKDPNVYNNKDSDSSIIKDLFKKYLKSKLTSQYPVVITPNSARIIPYSESLDCIYGYHRSMSDCGAHYFKTDDEFCNKFTKQI